MTLHNQHQILSIHRLEVMRELCFHVIRWEVFRS